MRDGTDVSVPGDGKAYQLMATLIGYAELYRHTANADYLKPAVTAWEVIRSDHLYETGGPWSYKSDNVKNQECFAAPRYFHPTNYVETCSTTTWIQLSLLLWRLTGEPRFANEAERAVLNHLLGAQSPNGNDWAYFTMPNQSRREYKDQITCCASSGPRGLELYARHLAARTNEALVLNSYLPMSVPLTDVADKPARIVLEGEYPFREQAALTLESERALELTIDFRVPAGVDSLEVTVDSQSLTLRATPLGYLRLRRVWRPGEEALIRFDMPPKAHFRTGRNGERWVTFTRGPLALAQDVRSEKGRPPNVLKNAQESEDVRLWLEPIDQPVPNELPAWRFKAAREIVLVPYYFAGGTGGGVRTMFPTRLAQ